MPKKFGTKREELERMDFPNAAQRPLILTVSEAASIDTNVYRLYYVAWWEDEHGDALPSGFARMIINGVVPDDEDEYSITVIEPHRDYHYTVPADTLLLAFFGERPN